MNVSNEVIATVFRAGCTPERRQTVAAVLDGEPLFMLTQACAAAGDLATLKVLREQGRFSIDMAAMEASPRTLNAVVGPWVVPMIDAVCALMSRQTQVDVVHATPLKRVSTVNSLRVRVHADADMKDFVRGCSPMRWPTSKRRE